jgi:hypothetical protein
VKAKAAAFTCPTPTGWAQYIKPLFRPSDVSCMLSVSGGQLNLADAASVQASAGIIYKKVSTGQMPQGGPRWTPDMVSLFQCWMTQGYPP